MTPVATAGSPAVSSGNHIEIKVIHGKDGASHRCMANNIVLDAQLINHLTDQAVGNTMSTTRAIMEGHV